MSETREPTRAGLAARLEPALEQLGVRIPGSADRLAGLALLVSSWGKQINLSGHREPEAIADRLILDAAGILSAAPSFSSLADLGSGAGFPGLPIAILRPGATVVLVEARQRRHHFQRAAVRELGIENAQPLLGRIEALAPVASDLVLAQAVGQAGEVLALARSWAKVGGVIGIPATAGAAPPPVPDGCGEVRSVGYRLPGGPPRQLWLTDRER